MKLIPAIDILDGKVVRLQQGDYTKVSTYSNDPLNIARSLASQGYSHLHVIDLSGAKSGHPHIIKQIESMTQLGLSLQVGGGIRTLATARAYLDIGVKHVIVSTKVLREPLFVDELIDAFGCEPIIVSLDVSQGKLRVDGWIKEHSFSIEDVLKRLSLQGVKRVIITDISRDGTLAGVNIQLYRPLIEAFSTLKIFAAGGIASARDIEELKNLKLAGAIVGKAFYESCPL